MCFTHFTSFASYESLEISRNLLLSCDSNDQKHGLLWSKTSGILIVWGG